jgi:hypothetical protein
MTTIGKIHSMISLMNWNLPNNQRVILTTPKNAIRVGRDNKMVRGRDYRINDVVVWCIVAPKTCTCKGPNDCKGHHRSR